ncbi:MAG TPA: protein kinase, partial [Acidobacteriota bacterium]
MTDDERPSLRLSSLEQALGGKYKIIERIGLGGFGEVYLGEHNQLHRKVAIKLLSSTLAGQKEVVERFQREAKAAATMSHPNIIDIYDVGQSGDIYYFVMKFIDGETLSERMHRLGKISPAEAIHIIRQVADALAYAHVSGIIHRDIKPANVMLDEYGKPVLMDFGVARVQFEGNLTKTGTLMGTPHYLPPELPLGKKVDGRSDIYSLGIMLYEMLGGRPPFHDENSVALIFKHINETPTPLKELCPDLDDALAEAVHKMIEKLPEKRYQTADEVVDVLHSLTGIYPAPAPSSLRRSTPGVSRNTEKLLLLAHEHVQQEKYDRAIELYATLTRRDPNNESARREIAELTTRLIEKLRQQISEKAFAQARELLAQAQQIGPNDERLNQMRDELKKAEEDFWNQKESEFRVHYDAAQMALQSDNAVVAIEHLTKASTIHATSPELQDLLKKTQDRITGEINMLCEKLDFTGAEEM